MSVIEAVMCHISQDMRFLHVVDNTTKDSPENQNG